MDKLPNIETAKLCGDEVPGVDLCIMLDCTGSMGTYIDMSKRKIKDVITQVNQAYAKSKVRVAIVGYRDVKDKKRFELQPFTESGDQARSFIDTLHADGGDDTPEDVNGAFQKALYELKWDQPVRILVLVADAPCHGKEFHNADDHFPKGHKDDKPWNEIWKDVVETRLDFLMLKITNQTDLMVKKFREMYIQAGGDEASFQEEMANGNTANAKDEAFTAAIAGKCMKSLDKEIKKSLAKKLEKRTGENAELVKKIRETVAENVAKLNLETLIGKYNELNKKLGDCILSGNTFIEALADEDCLCLTFDIGRSQGAIMDPTQVIIKNVFPSMITAGSFFYSTEFALKKDKLAHGGWEKHNEGLIIKGAASENITGVMPLFICEENWTVAKHLMKLTLGWDVTLEPAGYMYAQMKTVPFLVLAKLTQMLHEKPESEFLKFQFDLVKRTCIQIMEDGSKEGFENKFNEEVIGQYEKYLEDPANRTVDVIPSNAVFLAQLYIVKEMGYKMKDKVHFDEMFRYIVEEDLRRKGLPNPETLNTTEWMIKLLNVNIDEYVTKPVNAWIDEQREKAKKASTDTSTFAFRTKFLSVYEALVGSKLEEKEEKKEDIAGTKTAEEKTGERPVIGTEKQKYEYKLQGKDGYNSEQTKAIEEYKETLKRVMFSLYPLRMLFDEQKAENPLSLKEWGIQDDFQFFTMYIQNKLQHKNANRREAFTNKTYRNPWTEARDYVESLYNKLVEDEKSGRINKYLAEVESLKSSIDAKCFAETEDLIEAAGALMGNCVGCNVGDFFNAVISGNNPLLKEKLEILVKGHYKGVKLYKDAESWTPGRWRVNKFFVIDPHRFSPEVWSTLFEKLSLTFLRRTLEKNKK